MSVRRHAVDFAVLDVTRRDRFARLETTLLSDAMDGRNTMAAAIAPLAAGTRLVGQARTAFSPGAVRAAIVAIAVARPGEVLVVDGGGGDSHATLGGIMARDALRGGLAGCVIDGLVRDSAEIRELGLAMFCRGAIPHGAALDPRGAVDLPVRAGGVRVCPGDVIVGDDDGVVAVPLASVDGVLERAEAKRRAEAEWVDGIESGRSLAAVHGFEIPPAE